MRQPPFHHSILPENSTLEIHLLGLVDFDAALFLQGRLVYEISGRNDTLGGLLLCEHPPLITVGREGSLSQILADAAELKARQMETRWLNRGGGCLVHGPGQLAVYPILPLDRLGLGLAEYRYRLEQAVINFTEELQIPAARHPVYPGVWSRCGQLAHVGIAVKSWVAHQGLFLNVTPKLDSLRLVQPHPEPERITSLSAQSAKTVSMNAAREGMIRHLTEQLGYARHHVYTGHPLLHRQKRRICVDA